VANLLTFQNERPLFLREQANKLYTVTAYFFGKTIIEIPLLFVIPIIPLLIVFWSFGFNNNFETFAKLYLMQVMLSIGASSIGYMISSLFTNVSSAVAVG